MKNLSTISDAIKSFDPSLRAAVLAALQRAANRAPYATGGPMSGSLARTKPFSKWQLAEFDLRVAVDATEATEKLVARAHLAAYSWWRDPKDELAADVFELCSQVAAAEASSDGLDGGAARDTEVCAIADDIGNLQRYNLGPLLSAALRRGQVGTPVRCPDLFGTAPIRCYTVCSDRRAIDHGSYHPDVPPRYSADADLRHMTFRNADLRGVEMWGTNTGEVSFFGAQRYITDDVIPGWRIVGGFESGVLARDPWFTRDKHSEHITGPARLGWR